MNCTKCTASCTLQGAIVCPYCGTPYPAEQLIPFVGVPKSKGIFRVTFKPVQAEFESRDDVDSAVRHSQWNRDSEFKGATFCFVRSTVKPRTHPFICGSCHDYVSPTNVGKCSGCGKSDWVRRPK